MLRDIALSFTLDLVRVLDRLNPVHISNILLILLIFWWSGEQLLSLIVELIRVLFSL